MRLIEFKAWFRGYCENINGTPTREQFDRIKEEIDNIQSDWYYNPNTFKVDPVVIYKNKDDSSIVNNILRWEYKGEI